MDTIGTEESVYSGTSDKGPSEIGTTSLQKTKLLAPKCPLFRGSTVYLLERCPYFRGVLIVKREQF